MTANSRRFADGRAGRVRGVWLPLSCLVALAAGIAVVGRANLFPLMSGDNDEPVYVYQARMLVQGHATIPARTHVRFFYPWLFGQRGNRLFSQYQPGWPSVIGVAHFLGDERLALVFAAVAVVVATWFLGEQVAPGSGVFAAGLLVLSPIFVVHAALYLPYLWTSALVTGALACVIAGVRHPGRVRFLAAGALFGVALLARPLDACIVAMVATVYVIVAQFRVRKELRDAVIWSALGALPFLLLTVIYNAHVTGSPWRFPLQAADHLDTFGFGARAMTRDGPPVNYTPHLAVTSLGINIRTVPRWFAGSGIGLLLALAAVVVHRRIREAWLLVACIAVFPVAYFFWWATSLAAEGAPRGLGPHYYVPAFAFLAVLAGWALHDLVHRSRALGGACVAAVVVGSLSMAPTVVDNAHLTTSSQRAKARPLTASAIRHAVVVMRADPWNYTLVDYPFLVGDPRLADDVLYATDRGADSARLSELFRTRTLYQLVQRVEPGHDLLKPSYIIEPMRVRTGSTVRLRFDTTNSSSSPIVVASLKVDGRTVAKRVIDSHSHAGAAASFDVVLGNQNVVMPQPGPRQLTGRIATDGQIEVDVAFGHDAQGDTGGDVYARRYFVGREGDGITVQSPGLQYHRFDFGKVVWVRENVGRHLAEAS